MKEVFQSRTLRDVRMRERYYLGSLLREQRMRIDCGILGIRIMRESKTPEEKAEGRRYLEPLREWDRSPNYPRPNAPQLGPQAGGIVSHETLLPVFEVLRKDNPEDKELAGASNILVRVLDGLRSTSHQ